MSTEMETDSRDQSESRRRGPGRKPSAAKRREILLGARKIFLNDGYSNSSMDSVALAAGVSKQTIYRYFPSKEHLFIGMMEELCDPLFRENVQGNIQDYPLEAGLLVFAKSFVNIIFSPDTLALHRLAMGEVGRVPQIGRLFYEGGPAVSLQILVRFFEQHADQLTMSRVGRQNAAEEFQSMLRGYEHFRVLLGIAPPPSQKARDRIAARVVRDFLERHARAR